MSNINYTYYNDLCTRYDTNTLNNLDDDVRYLFEEISKKCINENLGIGNTTLMKLILNNSKNEKPNFSKISGPMSLTVHWSEEYKKMIYIFGEYHGLENGCPGKECPEGEMLIKNTWECVKRKKQVEYENTNSINIVDYLKELFKNTNVFIDFFLEIKPPEYSDKDKGEYPNKYTEEFTDKHIASLWKHFIPCINVKSRVNPIDYCELTRVHYIDVRETHMENDMFNKFSEIYHPVTKANFCMKKINHKYITTSNIKFLIQYTDENNDKLRNFILHLSSNPKQAIMNQTKNNMYITKEIERSYLHNDHIYHWFERELDIILKQEIYIENSKYKLSKYIKVSTKKIISLITRNATIVNQIRNNYSSYVPLTKKRLESINKIPYFRMFSDQLCEIAHDLSRYMITIGALRIDIYTICRLFKKFNVESSNQPDEAYNSIIYTGNYHSNTYRNFLENTGFKLVDIQIQSENQPNNRCLDIDNIPQPFFTGSPTS